MNSEGFPDVGLSASATVIMRRSAAHAKDIDWRYLRRIVNFRLVHYSVLRNRVEFTIYL